MNRFKLEHYHDQGSEMVEDREGGYVAYTDALELQRQNYVLSEEVKSLRASGTDLMAHRNARIAALQRQLDEANRKMDETLTAGERLMAGFDQVKQQRDTALAALGQVQAAAAELMAAADALLRERDNYRAACQAAAALCKKGSGS